MPDKQTDVTVTEDFETKWDTEKQRADQEHANYEKATEQTAKAEAEKSAITEEFQAQAIKVAELEEQAKAQTADYPELDPDMVDKNVIKSFTTMKSDLKTAKDELVTIKGKVAEYEKNEQQKTIETQRNLIIEKMCKPLDDEFGAKYRNAAKNLADELVKNGKEETPVDAIDAMNLMRKCYKRLVEKEKSSGTVRTDTGGGGTTTPATEKKFGTTQEVLADMRKNQSWKE